MSSVILRRKSKVSGQLYYLSFNSRDGCRAVLITEGEVIPLKLKKDGAYKILDLSLVDLEGAFEQRGYKKRFIVKSCYKQVDEAREEFFGSSIAS